MCQMGKSEELRTHARTFDATKNWELEFPGAYKVRNDNSFPRDTPEKNLVNHHEILQKTRHILKIQYPTEHMLRDSTM